MADIRAVDIDSDLMDFAELGFAAQNELDAYIQEGLDSIEQHGTVPHAAVMAEIDALLARRAKE